MQAPASCFQCSATGVGVRRQDYHNGSWPRRASALLAYRAVRTVAIRAGSYIRPRTISGGPPHTWVCLRNSLKPATFTARAIRLGCANPAAPNATFSSRAAACCTPLNQPNGACILSGPSWSPTPAPGSVNRVSARASGGGRRSRGKRRCAWRRACAGPTRTCTRIEAGQPRRPRGHLYKRGAQ